MNFLWKYQAVVPFLGIFTNCINPHTGKKINKKVPFRWLFSIFTANSFGMTPKYEINYALFVFFLLLCVFWWQIFSIFSTFRRWHFYELLDALFCIIGEIRHAERITWKMNKHFTFLVNKFLVSQKKTSKNCEKCLVLAQLFQQYDVESKAL